MSKNILVTYFSCSGVTSSAAKMLADAANADLFEIKPTVPYTDADLNWQNKNSRSTKEMNDLSSRPEISEKKENMQDYNTVFVGFPIWWYLAPTIICTFLESYDFSGKNIVLFATSGGSGFGKTQEQLEKICSGKFLKGKILNGRLTNQMLKDWVESLDLI